MKIQLDTKAKTIRIEEPVNLKEFMGILKKILPNNEWESYSLDGSPIYNWTSPIIVERPYRWPDPWPWQQPIITYCDNVKTTNPYTIEGSGIYNLQLQ